MIFPIKKEDQQHLYRMQPITSIVTILMQKCNFPKPESLIFNYRQYQWKEKKLGHKRLAINLMGSPVWKGNRKKHVLSHVAQG